MSEEKATNPAGKQPAKYTDEFFTRRLGPDRFEVYRILGDEPGDKKSSTASVRRSPIATSLQGIEQPPRC
jgi:hypothetical protein